MMYKQVSEELLSLIQQSPSCFHAVRTISALLEEAGYTQLNECDSWKLEKGGKYYTTRNGSSVIAFAIGEELDDYHFQLTSSHSDSPTFKVKERAELKGKGGYLQLNTEGYGGMLCATWMDVRFPSPAVCSSEKEMRSSASCFPLTAISCSSRMWPSA